MKINLKPILAAAMILASSAAGAGTLDYIFIPNNHDAPDTFALDTRLMSDRSRAHSVETQTTHVLGTLGGAAYDFGRLLFGQSVYGGGVLQADGGKFGGYGPQLFTGDIHHALLRAGVFAIAAQADGSHPLGTLTAFAPKPAYEFDVKGSYLGSRFDLSFKVASAPSAYGFVYQDDPFGMSFSVDNVRADLNGSFVQIPHLEFYRDGGFQIDGGGGGGFGSRGGQPIVPTQYAGQNLFTGPLYNADFTPGVYAVTNDQRGDRETDVLTIRVPEASSAAAMIGGFGLIGLMSRRRATRLRPA